MEGMFRKLRLILIDAPDISAIILASQTHRMLRIHGTIKI